MEKVKLNFIPTKGNDKAVEMTQEIFNDLFKANQIVASLADGYGIKVRVYKNAKGYWNLTGETLDELIDIITE